MDTVLPLAAMDRLMRKYGAVRVSDSAKQALSEVLEKLGTEIIHRANVFATHTGRKTIKRKDIEAAKPSQ